MQLLFSMREVKSGLVQESFWQTPLVRDNSPLGNFLMLADFGAKRQQKILWTVLSQRLPIAYGKQEDTNSLGSRSA